MQKVAVFDFDGTIYKKDSLIEFCKFIYLKKPWRIVFALIQISALLLYRLNLISTKTFKQTFLLYLYNLSDETQLLIKQFWNKEYPVNFNQNVLDLIKTHKDIHIVCISASPDFMFQTLKKQLYFNKCISTVTNNKNGIFKIVGENCRGEEKLNRLNKEYPNGFDIELAVSDNKDDINLLNAAKIGYRVVDQKLIKI